MPSARSSTPIELGAGCCGKLSLDAVLPTRVLERLSDKTTTLVHLHCLYFIVVTKLSQKVLESLACVGSIIQGVDPIT